MYIISAICFVSVLVLVVGSPNLLSAQQEQEWETYLNPQYKFTLQYPDNQFGTGEESFSGNVTNLDLIGHDVSIYLSIIPLNMSAAKTDSALIYIQNQFNDLIKGDYV